MVRLENKRDGAFGQKERLVVLRLWISAFRRDDVVAELSIELSLRLCRDLLEREPDERKRVIEESVRYWTEHVNEGFLNLTTIYDKDATSGVYPAVHSRHFGLLGQPVLAQYAGTCTAK